MALRCSAILLFLMLPAFVDAAPASVHGDVTATLIRGNQRSLAVVAPCRASTLSGYTSSIGFNRMGFNLHWKVTSRQSIDIAVEAKTGSGVARGWFAIGWSKSGLMYPADAVIMNFKSDEDDETPPVGTFALSKREESGVKPTSRFAITNTEFTSNTSAGVLVRFTRSKFDGIVPVNYNGPNQIIFAYAPKGSQEVKGHAGKRGWAKTGSGAEKGWFSVGWSGSSSMVPSDAVIGNVKGLLPVASYAVSGYSASKISVTSRFAIGQPELLTSSSGVVMKFGRSKADGEGIATVVYKGKNKIIWAYSGSGSRTIDDHKDNYGSTTVDFSCKPAPTKC
ncbi:unnamed protein product [Closterium sp. NIES-64]|nr:unnamed protein product [Closterium sp. NIES-64]